MIRFFNVCFPSRTVLLAFSEALLIVAAWLVALLVRFQGDLELALIYEQGLIKIAVASTVLMLCMYYYDLYDSQILHRPVEVLTRLVQVLGTASLILAAVYHLYPDIQLGRGPFMIWIALAGVTLMAWRWMFRLLNKSQRLSQRTILLGTGGTGASITSEIQSRPELGLTLLGYVANGSSEDDHPNAAHLGDVERLAGIVESRRVDRIILAMDERRGRLPVELLLKLKEDGVIVQDAPELYEAITGKVCLAALRPSWLLFSGGFRVSGLMLIYKRLASLLLAAIGIVLTAPLMLLTALAIRLDSEGEILFRQKRTGKGGKPFNIYKFRSMRADADRDAYRPASHGDDRVTRVGRWLRRLRIDELPQLFNIIRGDMYFIGPRPFAVSEEAEFSKSIPFYSHRWAVRPGATGWAQVRRGYCATRQDNLEKLAYDLYYIKNLSPGFDLLILFETFKILLLGRGGR